MYDLVNLLKATDVFLHRMYDFEYNNNDVPNDADNALQNLEEFNKAQDQSIDDVEDVTVYPNRRELFTKQLAHFFSVTKEKTQTNISEMNKEKRQVGHYTKLLAGFNEDIQEKMNKFGQCLDESYARLAEYDNDDADDADDYLS